MAPNPISNDKYYDNKLNNFVESIRQNDMKALKKSMKSKLGKNVKLVQTGILIAFKYGNCEALRILLTSPLLNLCDDDQPLLHCVVLTSDVKVLQVLLADARFDVNRVVGDSDGRTPLMVACTSGKVEMVKALLNHPELDVNAKDDNREWSALCYALHLGTFEMVQMLLNHKDTIHNNIQKSLLTALLSVSYEDLSINFDLLNISLKKNFENEYQLKNLYNGKHELHEHFNSWISEELENKIREDYYSGNFDITKGSLGNK